MTYENYFYADDGLASPTTSVRHRITNSPNPGSHELAGAWASGGNPASGK